MRLIFLNPHLERFGTSVAHWVIRRRSVNKYAYILEEIIKNPNRSTAFVIDGKRSSFSTLGLPLFFIRRPLALIEFYVWALIHGINPLKCKIYKNFAELNPERDVVFTFARVSTQREMSKNGLETYQGVVVVHFTHYFIDTKKIVKKIQALKHPVICAESDLTKNEYFRHHFPFVSSVYILPFTYTQRFKRTAVFRGRHNKCFAIGTYFKSDSADFLEYFGDKPFHPMRHTIYFNSKRYREYIDSFITKHFDDKSQLRRTRSSDSWLIRIAKQTLPFFLLEKIVPDAHQKKYFSFDIVEKYNQYKMFISPEEAIGLPSVNAVEGMACGSAYLGINHPMYTDLGFEPGKHYIVYKEGSLQDLISTIGFYQKRPKALEIIANQGYEFVRERFNERAVAERFWHGMEEIVHTHTSGLSLDKTVAQLNARLAH